MAVHSVWTWIEQHCLIVRWRFESVPWPRHLAEAMWAHANAKRAPGSPQNICPISAKSNQRDLSLCFGSSLSLSLFLSLLRSWCSREAWISSALHFGRIQLPSQTISAVMCASPSAGGAVPLRRRLWSRRPGQGIGRCHSRVSQTCFHGPLGGNGDEDNGGDTGGEEYNYDDDGLCLVGMMVMLMMLMLMAMIMMLMMMVMMTVVVVVMVSMLHALVMMMAMVMIMMAVMMMTTMPTM